MSLIKKLYDETMKIVLEDQELEKKYKKYALAELVQMEPLVFAKKLQDNQGKKTSEFDNYEKKMQILLEKIKALKPEMLDLVVLGLLGCASISIKSSDEDIQNARKLLNKIIKCELSDAECEALWKKKQIEFYYGRRMHDNIFSTHLAKFVKDMDDKLASVEKGHNHQVELDEEYLNSLDAIDKKRLENMLKDLDKEAQEELKKKKEELEIEKRELRKVIMRHPSSFVAKLDKFLENYSHIIEKEMLEKLYLTFRSFRKKLDDLLDESEY